MQDLLTMVPFSTVKKSFFLRFLFTKLVLELKNFCHLQQLKK